MFDNLVTYHILRNDDLPAYDAIGYQYIMAGNGLFIRTETRFFTATIPVKRTIVRCWNTTFACAFLNYQSHY